MTAHDAYVTLCLTVATIAVVANVARRIIVIVVVVVHQQSQFICCGVDGCLVQRRRPRPLLRRTTAGPADVGWRSNSDANGRRPPLPTDAKVLVLLLRYLSVAELIVVVAALYFRPFVVLLRRELMMKRMLAG